MSFFRQVCQGFSNENNIKTCLSLRRIELFHTPCNNVKYGCGDIYASFVQLLIPTFSIIYFTINRDMLMKNLHRQYYRYRKALTRYSTYGPFVL